jgi:hypothetical protein
VDAEGPVMHRFRFQLKSVTHARDDERTATFWTFNLHTGTRYLNFEILTAVVAAKFDVRHLLSASN